MRVADVNDSLTDFEIDVEFKYILHEDDSAYLDDNDNILTTREFGGVLILMETFDDWLDVIENFGMKNHCWLFHDLYDHEYGEGQVALPIEDILRIGEIWVEIKPRFQYFYDLEQLQAR